MRNQMLRSSIKAIQEAVISLRPMSPACSQQARTSSFRDVDEAITVEGSTSGFSSSVISNRLFFSPCTSRSIMEEARARAGSPDAGSPENGEATANHDLYGGTIVVVLASGDPYVDFKSSMVEMVEAHGERLLLEELLLRYLRLNEKRNHKFILMAFVDVVKDLTARDQFPSFFASSSSRLLVSDR